jgi:glyceraldehyde-3-phosphate dehydrogenase (NADP+)
MVTFTGGPEAAENLIKKAGIKKYSMELGNNSPVIIWDNTNIDKMIESVVEAAFESQGENCIHAQRILIKEDIYDSIKNKMIHETEKLKIGDPLEHSTDIGPMISKGEAIRVYNAIREAEKNNAVILTGGERVGNIVKPTILENVNKESEIWKKEIFGPVTIIKPVKSIDEAIALSNDVPYGLQAGIFTSELDIALKAIEKLDYGAVLVNDTSDFRIDSMPFGGMKKSGLGREGIRFSIEEMTEIKLSIIKT